ncbi:TIR domain-containing protein [Psychrobacter lutiphocae]|uniref:TIR domain-containing protein n=1 Tax=Psychrobacter lutiphocae TaxID=540500 RepID=UPI000374C585|nr:TIR domain-containing protein [Psychrobacter lutiphocae]
MSLLSKFKGKEQAVINELLKQKLVNGNKDFAAAIAQKGQIVGFDAGDSIITQGEHDQDVYFIIAGQANMIINGSELYSRGPGISIGEMAAINPSRARSATLIATQEAVAVKVDVDSFIELIEAHPEAYKFISIDLADRLEQRNDLIKECNPKPRLFIVSTAEALSVAEDIRLNLDYEDIDVTLWSQPDTFQAGSYALESLERAIKTHDFGLAIMSADDIVVSREVELAAPRDNVIFELGLFMGSLGRERTLIAFPRGHESKLASDLQGLTPLTYKDNGEQLDTKNLAIQLVKIIEEKGAR